MHWEKKMRALGNWWHCKNSCYHFSDGATLHIYKGAPPAGYLGSRLIRFSPATLIPVNAEVRSQLLGRPADGKGAGCCDTGPRDFKGELLNSSRPCTAGSSCDGTAGAEGNKNPPPHHAHSLLSLRGLHWTAHTWKAKTEVTSFSAQFLSAFIRIIKLFPHSPHSDFPLNTWLCLAHASTWWLKSKMLSFLCQSCQCPGDHPSSLPLST